MSFGATFLRAPDLFPARNAGEPWGPSAFAVDCAGGPYRFGGLLPEQVEGLARRFGAPARPAAGTPAVEVRVFRAAAGDFRRFDLRGFDNHLDLDYRPAVVRMAGLDLMARLDRQPLRASLWTCATDGETFRGAAENLLRVVVAYRLLELGGALLHSAALAAPGPDPAGVHLFVGASGAGKSTLARLGVEAGLRPLSDDLNAVLPAAGGAAVAPLPFTGDLPPPPPGPPLPLRSIARLEKGGENRRRPLAPGALLASLAACAPYVNTDAERLDDLFGSLERLVAAVPGWVLTFRRDGGFHELLADRLTAPAGREAA